MGAGPKCGLDYFPFAVEHMSGTVENVLAPTLVANNESFGRLIACRLRLLQPLWSGSFPSL